MSEILPAGSSTASNPDQMSEDDLRAYIEQTLHRLSVENLNAIIEAAQDRCREKQGEVKEALLREFQEKANRLGMQVNLVPMSAPMGGGSRKSRRDAGQPLPVKFRGPNGETWSGRGISPKWLRELEEEGRNKEEFRVG